VWLQGKICDSGHQPHNSRYKKLYHILIYYHTNINRSGHEDSGTGLYLVAYNARILYVPYLHPISTQDTSCQVKFGPSSYASVDIHTDSTSTFQYCSYMYTAHHHPTSLSIFAFRSTPILVGNAYPNQLPSNARAPIHNSRAQA